MPHEISRILRAFASEPVFIDPRKGDQILALLEFRAAHGPRDGRYAADPAPKSPVSDRTGRVAVIRLYGPIVPRAVGLDDVSARTASLVEFQRAFKAAATDPEVSGIILDIDSPGGQIDLVPETAAMIRDARKADRPIVAIANTLAASAAYWIASAADELVVSTSGEVGSIGVYMMHEDVSRQLEAEGVTVTFIAEGPRKVEASQFEPLSTEARAALQSRVRTAYDMFTRDVARGRGVPVARVKADPEKTDKHFGGGRVVGAREAVQLGMADRVATLDETENRLQRARR